VSAGGFAQRPAGASPVSFAGRIRTQHERVDELRRELGWIKAQAAEAHRGGGLVELDLLRAMTALGAAGLALDRAERHAELEP